MGTSSISMIRPGSLHRQAPLTRNPVRLSVFLGWVLLFTAGGIFCLWTCLSARAEQRRIASLKGELQELRMVNSQFKGEVARLENPARVEKIAREQIGLVYPEPSQVMRLGLLEDTKEVSMARP